jgi:hypothetical protein
LRTAAVAPEHRIVPDEWVFSFQGAVNLRQYHIIIGEANCLGRKSGVARFTFIRLSGYVMALRGIALSTKRRTTHLAEKDNGLAH